MRNESFLHVGKAEIVQNLRMWYHPPEPSRHQNTAPAPPDPYFLLPFFLWAPQRFWGVQFSCNEECQANQRAKGSKVWIYSYCSMLYIFHESILYQCYANYHCIRYTIWHSRACTRLSEKCWRSTHFITWEQNIWNARSAGKNLQDGLTTSWNNWTWEDAAISRHCWPTGSNTDSI